jgi:hypothetical protein
MWRKETRAEKIMNKFKDAIYGKRKEIRNPDFSHYYVMHRNIAKKLNVENKIYELTAHHIITIAQYLPGLSVRLSHTHISSI